MSINAKWNTVVLIVLCINLIFITGCVDELTDDSQAAIPVEEMEIEITFDEFAMTLNDAYVTEFTNILAKEPQFLDMMSNNLLSNMPAFNILDPKDDFGDIPVVIRLKANPFEVNEWDVEDFYNSVVDAYPILMPADWRGEDGFTYAREHNWTLEVLTKFRLSACNRNPRPIQWEYSGPIDISDRYEEYKILVLNVNMDFDENSGYEDTVGYAVVDISRADPDIIPDLYCRSSRVMFIRQNMLSRIEHETNPVIQRERYMCGELVDYTYNNRTITPYAYFEQIRARAHELGHLLTLQHCGHSTLDCSPEVATVCCMEHVYDNGVAHYYLSKYKNTHWSRIYLGIVNRSNLEGGLCYTNLSLCERPYD